MKTNILALFLFLCMAPSVVLGNENGSYSSSDSVANEYTQYKYRSLKRDSLPKGIQRPFVWLGRYLTNSNKQEYKKFDCTILGGPFFNSSSGLGIAGGVSGMYSWDRNDPTLQRSSVSVAFTAGLSGMMQFGFRGNNFMKGDRYRWDYKLVLYYLPTKFWGIGYNRGLHDDNECKYTQVKFVCEPNFLFRVAPTLYVGPQLDIMLSHAYDFENSSDTLLVGKRGLQNKDVNTFGGGLNIQYDSRDFTLNASRGHFFKIEQMFYPKLLNKYYFNCTDITYSTYVRPYKSAILAFEVNGQYNYSSQGGEVPWTYLAKSGEGNRLRGYYEGRYRDNGIIQAQIELRQHIWKRWGCALWVGGGNVFNNFQSINMERFLPSYGIGARWEMKRRVNIRFDFGFTRNKPGFCFNIGEAF